MRLSNGLLERGDQAVTSDPETQTRRWEEQRKRRQEIQIDPQLLDVYTGYYQLNQFEIFTVLRQGDQLLVQLTGQQTFQVYPESTHKFFYKVVPAQISFVADPQSRAATLILHQNGLEQSAKRIDQAEAQSIEADRTKRIKDATPMPGSEPALRRQIEAFERGQPNYTEMTEELATGTRPQLPQILPQFAVLGPLQSIAFRGVGFQGWDIYEAKFANGIAICRILLTPHGKITGLLFQWGP